ncbi:hypothetical protein N7E81_11230 [Reichenbachiella carrageenanivorans]|uniref:DUF3566 domain-containing protein n=1 Tax=Reichenbachiella carrageenanivorans TaxID=2979869 RepID=A0ABY6CYN2_9BACT|nr:hypothetical protein [Reichenbachiella carrageenanivorans]UXX77938.1 hypothetical protein N7E81_11230 [Reichenbachiella carrageenanivorans]
MIRVKKFGVLQTAKVVAMIYVIVSLVIIMPFAMIASMFSDEFFPEFADFGAAAMLMIPVMYGVMGFIFTAIGCVVYNLIAGFTGGIEIEMETAEK